MSLLTSLFSKLYQYATVFIIVGSPLFFVPVAGFMPEVTYYMTMIIVVAVALVSYILFALLSRSWHSVSRLEFISYIVFSLGVVLAVLFARDPMVALFGNPINSLSGVSLLSLPAIMYLVRTLPAELRNRLKYVLAVILAVSAFIFMLVFMFNGSFVDVLKKMFSGFSSSVSFAVYMGIFVLACFVYVRKAALAFKYKAAISIVAVMFLSWAVLISSQEAVRPTFTDSILVGKSVLMQDGVFGIGAGDYARAWQLYRPQSVIASGYFAYDFAQGFSTITTIFVTTGIVGLIGFLMLTLTALYSTFMSYRKATDPKERFMSGFLTIVLLYLAVLSWVAPLSYAMLVVWMVIGGFGLAKAQLHEYHPSKKLAFIVVPLAVLLVMNAGVTVQKARAFKVFNKAQAELQASGPTDLVGQYMSSAEMIYPFDGFYRAHVDYIVQAEQLLLATTTDNQEAIKTVYLEKAQMAVDAALLAVKKNPSNYQNYVSLGRSYELAVPFDKEGAYDRAKKSYEEAIKLYPENPYLYVMLARLEASAGSKEGVRLQLTEALKKKQNFADALYLMSQLEASDNKIDEALAYAIEAVKNAPEDPLTYIQAGLLYYGKKDYQNAVDALQLALEKDPNNANVAYFLALSLRDGGRPDIAKTIADELLRRNPGNPDLETFLKSLEPKSTTSAKK